MAPTTNRVPSPIQKQSRNPRLPRASTFPIVEKHTHFPHLKLPHLDLFTNHIPQPSTPMPTFSSASAGMSFAGPSLSFPSLLPSPTSPTAGSAALSLLLPPTPPPPMSDFPFSPLNSAGMKPNELQLPSSPLHHSYQLESDLNTLLRVLTPPNNSQQFSNPEFPNSSQQLSQHTTETDLATQFNPARMTNDYVHQPREESNIVTGIKIPVSLPNVNRAQSSDSQKYASFSPELLPAAKPSPTPANIPSVNPTSSSFVPPALRASLLRSTLAEHAERDEQHFSQIPATRLNVGPQTNYDSTIHGASHTQPQSSTCLRLPTQNINQHMISTALPQLQTRPDITELTAIGQPQKRVRGRRSSPNSTLVCPECNQLYSRRDNLRAHVRGIHHGDKPYKCNNCGERFRWASTLRSHEATNKCRRDDSTPRRRGRARGNSNTPLPRASTTASTSNSVRVPSPLTMNDQAPMRRSRENVLSVHGVPPQILTAANQVQSTCNVQNISRLHGIGKMETANNDIPRYDNTQDRLNSEQPETSNCLVLSAPWNELGRAFEDTQDASNYPKEY